MKTYFSSGVGSLKIFIRISYIYEVTDHLKNYNKDPKQYETERFRQNNFMLHEMVCS